jgi:hypothetical protein
MDESASIKYSIRRLDPWIIIIHLSTLLLMGNVHLAAADVHCVLEDVLGREDI